MESCQHREATWNIEKVGYSYRCPPPPRGCSLFALGATPEQALRGFRLKAERQKVEALKKKRSRGEKLTDAEKRTIAYSVHGTAASCSSCYQIKVERI